jgi:hypothetical protein
MGIRPLMHAPHDGVPPLQLLLPGQCLLLHEGVDPQRVETLRLLRREKWRVARVQDLGQCGLSQSKVWASN